MTIAINGEQMAKASNSQERRIEWLPLGEIQPAPTNPKEHDIGEICVSIGRRGFVELPAIDERTGRLVAGHGRIEALMKLEADKAPLPGGLKAEGGKWLVPVVRGWASKNDADAAAYLVASNRLVELGGWNDEMLSRLMAEIAAVAPAEIEGSGFDQQDVDKFINDMNSVGRDVATDEIPTDAPTVSKKGDVWQLGNHRLMCGSCTDAADVGRLMSGAVAEMCFTSPPYGIGDDTMRMRQNLSAGKHKSIAAKSAYIDHDDSPDKWADLMRDWFAVSQAAVSGIWIVNVQMLSGNKVDLLNWVASISSRIKDIAIWDKCTAPPSIQPGVLSSQFELMLIIGTSDDASRRIHQSSWHCLQPNIVQIPKNKNQFSEHGAAMPVDLANWAMGTICDTAKSIFEPFSGTGTTICAAESLGKTCYAMELTPRYVDIAINRWEKMTGLKAVKCA